MIRNNIDVEEILKEKSDVELSKFNSGKYNKTTMFLLPLLTLSHRTRAMSKYLKNAFLDDGGIEHDFVRPVFVLMKVKSYKEPEWIDFCRTITTVDLLKNTYVTDYYVGMEDGYNLIMYVFSLPETWSKDYELFKQGRYSRMSEAYKKKFPKDVYLATGEKRESQIWGALYKSDALKDAVVKEFINPGTSTADDVISLRRDMDSWDEIWDRPRTKEEVFRLNQKEDYANTDSHTQEILQHRADC